MLCALYLEWRTDVVSFRFEPRRYQFAEHGRLESLDCTPDYEAILTTGELIIVEAKYDPEQLTEVQRARLALAAAHFARKGVPYEVVYRSELERNGFIDTVFLLRQYGLCQYPDSLVKTAERRLVSGEEADLWAWRQRAEKSGVSTPVLYHLLYRQRLPLVYRPVQFEELTLWRA